MNQLNISILKEIFSYSKPYKITLISILFWAFFLSLVASIRPLLINLTIDTYFLKTIENPTLIQSYFIDFTNYIFQNLNKDSILYGIVTMMFLVLFFEVIAQYLFTLLSSTLGQNIVNDIRNKLFNHLSSFKLSYFDNEPVGKIITRCISDIENIASIFSQGLFSIFSDIVKMCFVLTFMLIINWKITSIVLISMPIILIATNIFNKKMKVAFNEVRNEVANLNTFIQERLSGMKIVQLFNREELDLKKFKIINEKHNKAWLKNILYNSIFFPVADIVASLTLGFVVYFGAIFILNEDGLTTPGQLISFNMYITMLFTPLRQIADKFNVLQMGTIAAERVFESLNDNQYLQENGKQKIETFKGTITFKNVYFGYKENQTILKNINFTIEAGKTLAIVGATGAGKSTIINLLNRFYDIQSGSITIDGININDIDLSTLRNEIAVVLQDVFLFADSIKNNVTLTNSSITEQQLTNAAKEIGIHDFIITLPNQYDYDVKERGATLSAGQRQLLAFLRTYIYNPSILILDEATSNIDVNSEELIKKAIKKITTGRTSIIIAHRLSTILNADIIMVLNKGEIVEMGNHNELLQLENGFYKKLFEAQFLEENK